MYELTHSSNPSIVYTVAAPTHWGAADKMSLNCGFRDATPPNSPTGYWVLETPSGYLVTVRQTA